MFSSSFNDYRFTGLNSGSGSRSTPPYRPSSNSNSNSNSHSNPNLNSHDPFFPASLPLEVLSSSRLTGLDDSFTRSRMIMGDDLPIGSDRSGIRNSGGPSGTMGTTATTTTTTPGGSSSRPTRTRPVPSVSIPARSPRTNTNTTTNAAAAATATTTTASTTTTPSQSNSTLRSSSNTTTKNYHCTYEGCFKGFMTIPHMKRHLKSHSGLQPYDCPFCSKKFGRSDVRNKHVQSTHEDRAAVAGVGPGASAGGAGIDGLTDHASGSGVGRGKGRRKGKEGVGGDRGGGVGSSSGSRSGPGRGRRTSDTSLGLTSPLLLSDSHQLGGETESRAAQKEKKGKGRGRRSSLVSNSGPRRSRDRPMPLPSPIPIPIPLRQGGPTSALSASTIYDSFSPNSAFSPTPPTPRTGLPSLSSFSPATAPLHLGALGNSWMAPSDTRMYATGGFGLGLHDDVDELDEEDEDEMAFGKMEDKDRSGTSGTGGGGYHVGGHYYSSSMSTGVGITAPGTNSNSTFTQDVPSANSTTPSYEFTQSHPAPSYFSSSLFPLTNATTSSSYTSYRSPITATSAHHLPPLPALKWGSEAYLPPNQQHAQHIGASPVTYTGHHRYHKSQDSLGFTSPTTGSSDTSAISTSNLPTMFSQSLPVSNPSMYSTGRPSLYSLGSDPTLPTLQTLHQSHPQQESTIQPSTSNTTATATTTSSGLNVIIPRGTPQYGPVSAPVQSEPYRFSSMSDMNAGEYGMARSGDASGAGGYDGTKSNRFGTRNHDDILKNMGFRNPFENRS